VAAPAYLDHVGNVYLPDRLHGNPGDSLEVVLIPRPPETTGTIANADQTHVSSVSWVDDAGTGHLEPLWTTLDADGNPLPSTSEGLVEIDLYSGSFVRARATGVDLSDGNAHAFTFDLAKVAGPNGAVIHNVADLRSHGGAVWFDAGGSLGKVKAPDGSDYLTTDAADAVQARTIMVGREDLASDPGHPVLALTDEAGPAGRRRATLGDLFPLIGAYYVTLRQRSAVEVDLVGITEVPPSVPEGPPPLSDVTVVELARSLAVGLPSDPESPVHARLKLAILTAEDAVGYYTHRRTPEDWPTPFPAGPHTAILQVASRVYRAVDVTFGVLQTELGTAFTGRWITPEVELALLGTRKGFGIA
jgi:hypothetical protein